MRDALKSNSAKLGRNNDATKQQLIWVSLLWLLVLVSALMTIYAVHDTRNKFSELEILRTEQNRLQVERGKYLLEESAYASFGRVEKIATEQLAMKIPSAEQIIVVSTND